MPQMTMEEMLTLLDQRKGAIIGGVLTFKSYKTVENKKMLVNKRGTKKPDLIPTVSIYPEGVYHLISQQVMLGTDYKKAVDRQRDKEAREYMESLPPQPKFMAPPAMPEIPEFIPEAMWKGNGERDEDFFPRFITRHKIHGGRYLTYRPHDGKKLLSEYYDVTTGRKLDKKIDLEDFLPAKKPTFSKAQGTEQMIPWEVCMIEHVISYKINQELYEIIPAREPAGA